MSFQFVTYGRYISVDAKWLIIRDRNQATPGYPWKVQTWDSEHRAWVDFQGKVFKALNDAKEFVSLRSHDTPFGTM